MSTILETSPHSLAECQAKDPATCRFHGTPLGHSINSEADLDAALDDLMQESEPELVYQPSTTFPSEQLPAAEAIIDRANRRLERAGVAERFTYTAETFVREVDGEDIEYTRFSWNAPSISSGEWSFVASHEFTPGGQATSRYITEDAIRDTREISQTCDHCGAARHRQRVYWVRNEAGEIKQIGSSCLQAFLGVKPEGLWAVGDELNFRNIPANTRGSVVYPSERLVAGALMAADEHGGFVSQGSASQQQPSTAQRVREAWRDKYRAAGHDENYMARARELLTWARNLPADSDSQYLRNLRSAATDDNVKERHLPLVVSLIGSYQREQERAQRAAERAAAQANAPQRQQAFLAQAGEKITAVPATIRKRREFSNDFGGVTMFVLDTDDGYTLKWNSSNPLESYREGDRVMVQSATVKKTDIYNDEYQTILTRAKFAETPEPNA